MAITSLIVKIGAKDEEIQKALASLGKQADTVDKELARLGSTPVGREALKSIEQIQQATAKLTESHQRMADRAVQAARGLELVGGASKLTTSELAQLNTIAVKGIDAFRALGQDAPAGLKKLAAETTKAATAGQGFTSFLGQANGLLATFGVGLSVGAVINFGKSLLDMADGIQKVSDRTGLSIKEVQEFQYVAGQSGNTIEELTSALGQMQNRLVSGDKGAVGAIKALGLNMQTLLDASPADQMEQIATAIGKIPDPAQRTAVAMDVFGKAGAAILPTLISDFAKLRVEAPKMGDATVAALDKAGDQLARFGTQIKVWAAESYNLAGQGFDALIKGAYLVAASFTDLVIKVATLASKIPGASKALALMGADVATLTKDAQWFRDAAASMTARTNAVAESATKAAPKLKLFGAETTTAAKATKAHAEEATKLAAVLPGVEAPMQNLANAMKQVTAQKLEAVIPDMTAHLQDMEAVLRPLNETALEFGYTTLPNVSSSLKTTADTVDDADKKLHDLAKSFALLAQISGDSFGGIVKDIARVVSAMDLGAQAAKQFRQALESRDAGGIATGVVGIVGAMDQATASTSRFKATIGGAATGMKIGASIAGPYGAAVGAVAGAFVGLIRSAGAAEKAINPIREQFVQMNGGLAALNQRAVAAGVSLKAMLNAKNAEQYKKAIDDLNAAFAVQDNAMAKLNEAVERYGFTLEELGPTMQRQELDKQAQQLFQDWTVLNAAGINTVTITGRMAEAINDYVKRAISMGVEVPSAMKPMLQAMIDQGLLTDASGKKIENLEDSGISFAQTMSEGFKSVVDEVKKLADAITRSLGGAIAGLPTHKTINIGFDVEPPDLRGRDAQYSQPGARVLPFVAASGASSAAAVTARDLTPAQQSAVSLGVSGGGAVVAKLDEIARMQKREYAEAPRRDARIVRDAIQTAGLRR